MKITHVTTRMLRTPADNPLVVGLPAPTDTREFVTLELGTDQGLVGIGLTFFGGALDGGAARRLSTGWRGLVDRRRTRCRSRPSSPSCGAPRAAPGPGGIFTLALSAIDIALLGPQGQGARPVGLRAARRLRDRVPTYASGALMRPHPVDYLGQGRTAPGATWASGR